MKLGLAFSGGKDSLACLFLNLDKIQEITVFFVNTGKNYPETLQIVEQVKKICPNFVEIKTDKEKQNRENGLPSDLVSVDSTRIGMQATGFKPVMVQCYIQCCYENISRPLMNSVKAYGVTHLIRGQRDDEDHKAPSKNGAIVEGITFLHPIEKWSSEDVYKFLQKHMEIPEHLYLDHSSLDCYDCTGYLAKSKDRLKWAKINHPKLAKEHQRKLKLIRQTLLAPFSDLEELCNQ